MDPLLEGHLCSGASTAGANHLHVGNVVFDAHEKDVPAIARDDGANLVEGAINALLDLGKRARYCPKPFINSCMRPAMATASFQWRCHMLRPKIRPTHPASMAIFAL